MSKPKSYAHKKAIAAQEAKFAPEAEAVHQKQKQSCTNSIRSRSCTRSCAQAGTVQKLRQQYKEEQRPNVIKGKASS